MTSTENFKTVEIRTQFSKQYTLHVQEYKAYGEFIAVYLTPGYGSFYTVNHRPTGYALGTKYKLRQAQILANLISRNLPDTILKGKQKNKLTKNMVGWFKANGDQKLFMKFKRLAWWNKEMPND